MQETLTQAQKALAQWDEAENPWQDSVGIDYGGSDALTIALGSRPQSGNDSVLFDDGSALEYMGDDRGFEARSKAWSERTLKQGIRRLLKDEAQEPGDGGLPTWQAICKVANTLASFL